MPRKRYRVEQIMAKLREAEKLQGQGLTVPQTCNRLGSPNQTFYRWRITYALKEDEAQRLRALEAENARGPGAWLSQKPAAESLGGVVGPFEAPMTEIRGHAPSTLGSRPHERTSSRTRRRKRVTRFLAKSLQISGFRHFGWNDKNAR